jgi:hypothetical protein
MKNNKIIILITTIIYVAAAFACHKPEKITCGDLPCPSETGANVASCYIDGVPFISLGNKPHVDMFSCNGGSTLDTSTIGGVATYLNLRMCNNFFGTILFTFHAPLALKKYSIGDKNNFEVYVNVGGQYALTDSLHTGTLTITKLTPKIISGNFSFKAHTYTNSIIEISNGNFDLSR